MARARTLSFPASIPWMSAAAFVAIGCTVEPQAAAPMLGGEHCGAARGDATCQRVYSDRPYCSACTEAHLGCVAERPAPSCQVEEERGTTSDDGGTSGATGGAVDESSSGSTSSSSASSSTTGYDVLCDNEGAVDSACEAEDPNRPFCSAGACVDCATAGGHASCEQSSDSTPVCTGAGACASCTELPSVCTDTGLVCSPTGACVACSSHADCPQSACHLAPDDPRFGQCFATTDVLFVDRDAICPGLGTAAAPNCSLAQAVASAPAGHDRVIFVDGVGTPYEELLVVPPGTFVAVMGSAAPILAGAADGDTVVLEGGTLYGHGLRIEGNASRSGVRCTGGTLVLTGSVVRDNARYGVDATAPCAIQLERSSLVTNGRGGIRMVGGTLRLDNSAVGVNGSGDASPGLLLYHTAIDVLYSTIAGNDGAGTDSLQCVGATGTIRNSVVVGRTHDSLALDCFDLQISHSAIDTASFAGPSNTVAPAFVENWFVDAQQGDFRLAAPPLTPFGGVASWQPGDPRLDADGTARPQDAPGYAGVDEP